MKFIKKYRLFLITAVILVLFIILYMFIKQQKMYKNNPGLIPPKGAYDLQIVLTDEQKTIFEADLKKYNDLIKDKSQYIDEDGVGIKKPRSARFIEKARALENLGRYKEAIQTYNQLFKYYDSNSVGRINLGGLYETLKKPELAVLQYVKLLETIPNFDKYYYKKIINLYIKLNDSKQARERYEKYEKINEKKDEDLLNQIKGIEEIN